MKTLDFIRMIKSNSRIIYFFFFLKKSSLIIYTTASNKTTSLQHFIRFIYHWSSTSNQGSWPLLNLSFDDWLFLLLLCRGRTIAHFVWLWESSPVKVNSILSVKASEYAPRKEPKLLAPLIKPSKTFGHVLTWSSLAKKNKTMYLVWSYVFLEGLSVENCHWAILYLIKEN